MNYAGLLGSIFAVHIVAMMSPGPNFLVVTQTSMSRTRRAGVATALGVAAGAALWAGSALLGLSVLFNHFASVYGALKLLGGFYLLYQGVKLWYGSRQPLLSSASPWAMARTDLQAFRLGLLTNLTNPKAVIFYGSVFAAFVAPDLPVWVKRAAFIIIVVDAIGWHVALACLFSTLRARQIYERARRWIDRIAGTALVLLGLRLTMTGH